MKNLAAQRERAMNAVNGLTFEQVETAAQVMEFAVQKYGNQPSILAGLAFMAGMNEGVITERERRDQEFLETLNKVAALAAK